MVQAAGTVGPSYNNTLSPAGHSLANKASWVASSPSTWSYVYSWDGVEGLCSAKDTPRVPRRLIQVLAASSPAPCQVLRTRHCERRYHPRPPAD